MSQPSNEADAVAPNSVAVAPGSSAGGPAAPSPKLMGETRWLLPAQYAGSVAGLVFTLIVARTLGVRAYGVLAVTMAFPGLVVQFLSPKASTVLSRDMARAAHQNNKSDFDRAVVTCVVYDTVTTALALVLVVAAAPIVTGSILKESLPWQWPVFAAIGHFLFSPIAAAQAALISDRKTVQTAILTVADAVLPLLILLLMLAVGDVSPEKVLLTTIFSQAIVGLSCLGVVYTMAGRPRLGDVRAMFVHGVAGQLGWNWVFVTCSGLGIYGPIMLTGWLLGPTQAGVIRLAQSISTVASYVLATLARVAYQRLASVEERNRERLRYWTFRIGLPFALAISLGSLALPTVVPIAFTASFSDAGWPACILALGVAFSTLFFWVSPHYYARGQTSTLAKAELAHVSLILAATAAWATMGSTLGIAIGLLTARVLRDGALVGGAWKVEAGGADG